jgi:hypothetical protein
MPDTAPHHDAILARLNTAITAYDAEVPPSPPVDPDGRVHPYTVLHMSAGEPVVDSLAFTQDTLDLPFQVTCVGGDITRCLWAVDKVRGALLGQVLAVPGRSLSPIASDGNSGAPRPDEEVTPPRHFLAVLFRLVSVPA